MEKIPDETINPWLTIWTRPRQTMRHILNTDPKGVIVWLAIISGILSGLTILGNLWLKYPHSQPLRYGITLFFAVIFGAILGIFHLYFNGWLYKITGNWIGGKGTYTEVRSAVGWAFYPFIITSIVQVLNFFLYRYPVLYYLLAIINFILIIWSVIILIKLIAEAHQFSAWRSLIAIIIAAILIIAFVMLLILLFASFGH